MCRARPDEHPPSLSERVDDLDACLFEILTIARDDCQSVDQRRGGDEAVLIGIALSDVRSDASSSAHRSPVSASQGTQ